MPFEFPTEYAEFPEVHAPLVTPEGVKVYRMHECEFRLIAAHHPEKYKHGEVAFIGAEPVEAVIGHHTTFIHIPVKTLAEAVEIIVAYVATGRKPKGY